jgi:arylsulfatase A-like enzyme
MQTQYLLNDIDTDVGDVLAAYSQHGALNDTYVVFTSDHGHTPVLKDQVHDLAFWGREAVRAAGKGWPASMQTWSPTVGRTTGLPSDRCG